MSKYSNFGQSVIDFDKTNKKRKRAQLPHQRDDRRHEALVLLLARELEHVEDNELVDVEALSMTLHKNAGFEEFTHQAVKESTKENLQVMGWSIHRYNDKAFASRGVTKFQNFGVAAGGSRGIDVRCCDQQVSILIDTGDSYPHFGENYAHPALPKKLRSVDRGDAAKTFMMKLFKSYHIEIME